MSSQKIYKGSDQAIEIPLEDQDGNAINPNTDLIGLVIILYYDKGALLNKYSLNAKNNYDPITVNNASKGLVEVKLQSAVTNTAKEGLIYAEVKAQEDNTSYQSNTFDMVDAGIEVGEIVTALSNHVDP